MGNTWVCFAMFIMLLLSLPDTVKGQTVQQVLTYTNISRPTGGAVSSGDILEIRAVLTVFNGTSIYKVKFMGTAPINTTYIPGTLAAKSNGGSTTGNPNVGYYTDAVNDDRGEVVSGIITINMGDGAGLPPANGGQIDGGSTNPRHGSAATIIMVTYRVTVNATNGSQLVTQGNSFTYANTRRGTPVQYYMNPLGILVTPQYACQAMDTRNRIDDETEGSFFHGTTLDRASSPIVTGFTYNTISTGTPNDGAYAVVKSTSPTQYTGSSPAGSDKVFSVWDIVGDHTGTTNGAGNPAPGNGVDGGYMLLVNAAYSPGSVFTTNVNGLPANFDFTFTFWVRNIVNNVAVTPNLILSVNGYDVYGTGDVTYSGQWVLKTFTFNTGSSTSVAINLRNNAPGGSGNDWVIDDFTLRQCLIVLPFNMKSFNALYQSGQTELKWEVESDDLIRHYIVEYSTDNKSFHTAGQVVSSGKGGQYRFIDTREVEQKMYYRLQSVDHQGKSTYSNVLIVRNQGTSNNTFRVAPNPLTSQTNVEFWSDSRQNTTVTLSDASGRLVYKIQQQLVRGSNSFPLSAPSNLQPGIYYLRIALADGSSRTSKVMIAR